MLNDEEAEEQRELMELNKKCQAQNEKEGNQEATNALNRVNSFSGSQTSEDFSH